VPHPAPRCATMAHPPNARYPIAQALSCRSAPRHTSTCRHSDDTRESGWHSSCSDAKCVGFIPKTLRNQETEACRGFATARANPRARQGHASRTSVVLMIAQSFPRDRLNNHGDPGPSPLATALQRSLRRVLPPHSVDVGHPLPVSSCPSAPRPTT
jgi:hypothetical protein